MLCMNPPTNHSQRSNLGDPLFVTGLDAYQNAMLSPTLAAEIRSKISDNKTFPVSYYNPSGLESLETPGTSHVVTADYTGMSISLTTTVNLLWGSRLVVPETGVVMNNEMNVSIPRLPLLSISCYLIKNPHIPCMY